MVDYVREGLRKGGKDVKLSALCEEICDRCCDGEMGEESDGAGCDNMTMMVVRLKGGGGGGKEEEVVGQARVVHHHQHHQCLPVQVCEQGTSPPAAAASE